MWTQRLANNSLKEVKAYPKIKNGSWCKLKFLEWQEVGFRFALCFCWCCYCHPLLLKITLVSYSASTLTVISDVLYLVTIFWSMCRKLWLKVFGHQWSENKIQSMPLSTRRYENMLVTYWWNFYSSPTECCTWNVVHGMLKLFVGFQRRTHVIAG